MSDRADGTGRVLERLFGLRENGTTVRTELRAGLVTFLTMSYIIFIQPAILSQAGMDFGAVMAATCISAAAATIMMGLVANYPIALAPGMGENFFFAFTVVVGMGVSWQVALGAVFLSGVAFFILSAIRLREMVIEAVPASLQHAIAAGIGVFIAFIGLQQAGIVVGNPGSLVQLGDVRLAPVLLALAGLVITSVLLVRKAKGAILWGCWRPRCSACRSGSWNITAWSARHPPSPRRFSRWTCGGRWRCR